MFPSDMKSEPAFLKSHGAFSVAAINVYAVTQNFQQIGLATFVESNDIDVSYIYETLT